MGNGEVNDNNIITVLISLLNFLNLMFIKKKLHLQDIARMDQKTYESMDLNIIFPKCYCLNIAGMDQNPLPSWMKYEETFLITSVLVMNARCYCWTILKHLKKPQRFVILWQNILHMAVSSTHRCNRKSN